MASVSITVHTGSSDYSVDLEMSETMKEAFGSDKSRLDQLVDEAVKRIKRAYTPDASGASE